MKKVLSGLCCVIVLFACHNNDTTSDNSSTTVPLQGIAAPQPITFTIDSIYPHDPKAFTQGLEFYNGKLYEGTGLQNETDLRIVDFKTGKVEKNHHIADTSIFGEGITIFNNKIYQLTWTSHKVFVYDIKNFDQPIKTLPWSSEGWGLTHDDHRLIVSDGSSNLYFVSPEDFHTLKTISVADNNGPVDNLNELELINGSVFANKWQTDEIYKIDTTNGHVTGKMNLTGLLAQYAAKDINNDTNVLNGIAYDSSRKTLFITGKKWPKLFAMHLN